MAALLVVTEPFLKIVICNIRETVGVLSRLCKERLLYIEDEKSLPALKKALLPALPTIGELDFAQFSSKKVPIASLKNKSKTPAATAISELDVTDG